MIMFLINKVTYVCEPYKLIIYKSISKKYKKI